MPASNETRVRVDDLEKISAQVWPASGCVECAPRSFLKTTASRRIFSKSARGNFSNDNRCFMSQKFWEFPPKENFITAKKTRRHFFFFAAVRRAPEIPRRRGAVRPPAFAECAAVLSASAFRVFCRRRESRCARQNRPPAKHLSGQAGKSTASPPSSARRRALPSGAR